MRIILFIGPFSTYFLAPFPGHLRRFWFPLVLAEPDAWYSTFHALPFTRDTHHCGAKSLGIGRPCDCTNVTSPSLTLTGFTRSISPLFSAHDNLPLGRAAQRSFFTYYVYCITPCAFPAVAYCTLCLGLASDTCYSQTCLFIVSFRAAILHWLPSMTLIRALPWTFFLWGVIHSMSPLPRGLSASTYNLLCIRFSLDRECFPFCVQNFI